MDNQVEQLREAGITALRVSGKKALMRLVKKCFVLVCVNTCHCSCLSVVDLSALCLFMLLQFF